MARHRWVPYAAIATLAAALYARTVGFGFVFDDQHLVVNNAFLREAWSPLRSFTHDFWFGTPFAAAYYRPMVTLSLAVNGLLFGWNPGGFHLVNVLVHATNTALLLALARRLGAPLPAATLAAAFFAVHPAAAWPVASVVARVDLLPALFVLLAWMAWARAAPPFLTGFLFLVSLLCKESAIAFLAVPLLGLRCAAPSRAEAGSPDEARARWRRAVTLGAAGAAVVAALAMRAAVGVGLLIGRGTIDPLTNPLAFVPLPGRAYAALALSGRYFLYLLAPFEFGDPHDYVRLAALPPTAPGVGTLLSVLLIATWGAGIVILWWRRDRLAVPLAFSLLSFLPAANLIAPICSLYAQNFLYLPLVGMSLCLAETLGRLTALRSARRVWPAIPVLALLAFAAWREAAIWRDGVTLFSAWTRRFPAYALGHGGLGVALLDEGDPGAAMAPLRKAIALDERDAEAHYNLGVALLLSMGERDLPSLEEALRHTKRAGELDPDLTMARVNASKILLALGRPSEAEAEARVALRLTAGLAPARLNLAESLFRQSRYAEAAAEFRDLTALYPADPAVRSPYVVSLFKAGDLEGARRQAEKARQDFPAVAWFDFCLARVEARAGQRDRSLALLREALGKDRALLGWLKQVDDFQRYEDSQEFKALEGR